MSNINNELFEYIIAYNCTINKNYLGSIIDHLDLSYITNKNVRAYLGIIFDFFTKRGAIPNSSEIKLYLTNEELINACKNVIIEFKTLHGTYNLEELLANTETFIKERAIYKAVKNTIDEVTETNNKNIDSSKILKTFEKACSISLIDNIGHDYFNNLDNHIEDLKTLEKYDSTGYPWLDKCLNGGWQSNGRALYLFYGKTNIGKSIVLGNLAAKQLERNKTVVLISLEMSEMMYAKRISSQLSSIPINSLKENVDLLKSKIVNFQNDHMDSKLIIKEFPPSTITPNHIKIYLERLQNTLTRKIDLIIIDYITLVASPFATGNMYIDGKVVAEKIRALSYPPFSCPIVSAGQVNREGSKSEDPKIETVGESSGISHTADAMFSLWATDAEKELGLLNIGLMEKNRFGKNFGKKSFQIDYETLTLAESDGLFSNNDEIKNISDKLENICK